MVSHKIFFLHEYYYHMNVRGCLYIKNVLTLENDGLLDLKEIFQKCFNCTRSLLGRTDFVILFPTMRFIAMTPMHSTDFPQS